MKRSSSLVSVQKLNVPVLNYVDWHEIEKTREKKSKWNGHFSKSISHSFANPTILSHRKTKGNYFPCRTRSLSAVDRRTKTAEFYRKNITQRTTRPSTARPSIRITERKRQKQFEKYLKKRNKKEERKFRKEKLEKDLLRKTHSQFLLKKRKKERLEIEVLSGTKKLETLANFEENTPILVTF